VIAANTFNIAADVAAMAASTRLVIDLPQVLLVVVYVALMMTLEITLPYHRYARVLRWLALSLLAYVFVLASVHVDWGAVVDSLLSPTLVGGAGGIAALIAVFGTTVSPYLFFWQASEEVEEEHEHGTTVDLDHLRAMRVDVIGGMISAVVVAFAIVVVAAATLHTKGITNIDTPTQAAEALRPLVGNAAGLVFALGIVGLGLLAVPVLAGASAYALAEAFDNNFAGVQLVFAVDFFGRQRAEFGAGEGPGQQRLLHACVERPRAAAVVDQQHAAGLDVAAHGGDLGVGEVVAGGAGEVGDGNGARVDRLAGERGDAQRHAGAGLALELLDQFLQTRIGYPGID